MPFKKIFRKVTRPIQKLIPKEIRPFVPYAASMFLPGIPGLPAAFAKYGGNEFIKAALARGVVDEDADFRDVLRTGITAALPKLVETGGSKFLQQAKGATDTGGVPDESILKTIMDKPKSQITLGDEKFLKEYACLLYTSPSPRD